MNLTQKTTATGPPTVMRYIMRERTAEQGAGTVWAAVGMAMTVEEDQAQRITNGKASCTGHASNFTSN
jgi:hypothetical protein